MTNMRKLVIHSLALLVALATTAGAQSWCLALGDSSVTQMLTLTRYMSPLDRNNANGRGLVGLSGLDTTDMQLITDDSVCIRVDSAVMRAGSTGVLRPNVVYKLGTNRYAAFTPGYGPSVLLFIDDHYEVVMMVNL